MASEGVFVSLPLELKSFVETTVFAPGETLDAEDNRYVERRAAACVSVGRIVSCQVG